MAGEGNPNHDPKNGEFTSGPGGPGGAHAKANQANRSMERAALDHVKEYHRLAKSGKLDAELKADIARRAARDRKLGIPPGQGFPNSMLGDANPFRKRKGK